MKMMQKTEHRPWEMPKRGWRVTMRWHDLLFAHWAVEPAAIAKLLPAGLKVDTREGRAWVGVVPFWMSGIRVRGLPRVPTTHTFAELNVRTYVTDGRKPGVWFFSLDAGSFLASSVAKWWYGLNYRHAKMACTNGDGWVHYESRRLGAMLLPSFQKHASGKTPEAWHTKHGTQADFRAKYRAVGEPFNAQRGTLEHWLCERYCMYMSSGGRVSRGEIHHEPWELHRAEAEIETNTMADPLGIALPGEKPHLLYARQMDAVAWGREEA